MYKLYYVTLSRDNNRYYYVGFCNEEHIPGVNYFTSSKLCNQWLNEGTQAVWRYRSFDVTLEQICTMEAQLIQACWNKHGKYMSQSHTLLGGYCLNSHNNSNFLKRMFDMPFDYGNSFSVTLREYWSDPENRKVQAKKISEAYSPERRKMMSELFSGDKNPNHDPQNVARNVCGRKLSKIGYQSVVDRITIMDLTSIDIDFTKILGEREKNMLYPPKI